jgi:hypothetical protein
MILVNIKYIYNLSTQVAQLNLAQTPSLRTTVISMLLRARLKAVAWVEP